MGDPTQEHLAQALAWRYATKRFDPNRKIGPEDWQLLRDSLRLAPSSYGLQPWHFTVAQSPGLRSQLLDATGRQAQVTDCSHFVVIQSLKKLDPAHIDRYLARVNQVQGSKPGDLAEYREHMVRTLVEGPRGKTIGEWARRQCYIAVGFLLLAAAELGIDACPIEGIDHAAYDRILGLDSGPWASMVAVALGYRAAEDPFQGYAKVRFMDGDVFDHR